MRSGAQAIASTEACHRLPCSISTFDTEGSDWMQSWEHLRSGLEALLSRHEAELSKCLEASLQQHEALLQSYTTVAPRTESRQAHNGVLAKPDHSELGRHIPQAQLFGASSAWRSRCCPEDTRPTLLTSAASQADELDFGTDKEDASEVVVVTDEREVTEIDITEKEEEGDGSEAASPERNRRQRFQQQREKSSGKPALLRFATRLQQNGSFASLQKPPTARQAGSSATKYIQDLESNRRVRKRRKQASTVLVKHAFQSRLLDVTSHSAYEALTALIIVLNCMVIAWETEVRAVQAWTTQEPCLRLDPRFVRINFSFSALFTLDISLRIAAQREYFFHSREAWFNAFDLLVVATSAVESIIGVVYVDCIDSGFRNVLSTASMLRLARLLRVIRVTRAVRSLLLFRELRVMVASLCGALVSLMWSMLIFFVTFFVFGVFFTDGAMDYAMQNDMRRCTAGDRNMPENCKELWSYYGGLFSTMASLYWAVSGGEDWSRLLLPLRVLGPEYQVVFYFFITFSMFAMLNVVTSVFVDSTMQRSQNDREFVVENELHGKQQFMELMEQVFEELDSDGSGQIKLSKLESHMNDPALTAYFSALSLDVKQVRKLFHLMDTDRSGGIDREEFIGGCLSLRGQAKNLDVAILNYETRRLGNLVVRLGDHLDECLGFGSAHASARSSHHGSSRHSPTSSKSKQSSRLSESRNYCFRPAENRAEAGLDVDDRVRKSQI